MVGVERKGRSEGEIEGDGELMGKRIEKGGGLNEWMMVGMEEALLCEGRE